MPSYAVELSRRYDGLFIATFPDLPDVVAYGRDDEEALEEAAKSLGAALLRRQRVGDPLPLAMSPGQLRVEAIGEPENRLA